METYVILRRNGWRTAEDLREAAERSSAEGERMSDEVAWIRSYVLAEEDGTVGTVCIYMASSPDAVRRHAVAAGLRGVADGGLDERQRQVVHRVVAGILEGPERDILAGA